MQFLKTFALFILCAAGGIGIGAGIFYGQEYLAARPDASAEVKGSTTPSPTPVTQYAYTSTTTPLSVKLPETIQVLETPLSGLASLVSGSELKLFSLDKVTHTLTDTTVSISFLAKGTASETVFTAAIAKLEKNFTSGKLATQKIEESTTSGLPISRRSYLANNNTADELATITTPEYYVHVFRPTSSEFFLGDSEVDALLKSLAIGSTPTTSSYSPPASNSALLTAKP